MSVLDENNRIESGTMLTAADMVRHTHTAHRRAGLKTDVAFADTGRALGVSARWVRAVLRGEAAPIRPDRAAAIQSNFRAWQKQYVAYLDGLIAIERAKLRAMESGPYVEGQSPDHQKTVRAGVVADQAGVSRGDCAQLTLRLDQSEGGR